MRIRFLQNMAAVFLTSMLLMAFAPGLQAKIDVKFKIEKPGHADEVKEVKGASSLAAAFGTGAGAVDPAKVLEIAISGTGSIMTTTDWNELKAKRANLGKITTFSTTKDVNINDIGNGATFPVSLTSVVLESSNLDYTVGNSAFEGCENLTTLSLPGAKALGTDAFKGCKALTAVEFPKVTSIGATAFSGCAKLATVSFPADVTSVGAGCFTGCPIASLTFGTKNVAAQFTLANLGSTAADLNNVTFTQATALAADPFKGYPNIENVTFSVLETATAGAFKFPDYKKMKKVTLPKAKTIGNSTFEDCTGLETIEASNTELIDASAFQGCTSLTSITATTFPNVTTLKNKAFKNCSGDKFTEVNFPKVATIELEAFLGCSKLTKVTIGGDLAAAANWGTDIFKSCTALENVSFPNTTFIADNAFVGKASLTKISFPAAVTVGDNAFKGCTGITDANMPEALTIGKNAFDGCSKLATYSFPKVTTIDDLAFQNCTPLTAIDFPKATSIAAAPNNPFTGCPDIATVNLPEYNHATNWPIPAGLTKITSINLDKYPGQIWGNAFLNNQVLKSASFKAATDIAARAFEGCTALESVNFLMVAKIGQDAFKGCQSLKNVSFPTKVAAGTAKITNIAATAFSGCTNLTTATFDTNLAAAIGANLFTNCTKLDTIKLTGAITTANLTKSIVTTGGVGNLTLDCPDMTDAIPAFTGELSLKSVNFPLVAAALPANAFQNCKNLESINFKAVTDIGATAFQNCEKLKEVSFPAVVAKIEGSAFDGCAALEEATINAAPAIAIGATIFNNCPKLAKITLKGAIAAGNLKSDIVTTTGVGNLTLSCPDMVVAIPTFTGALSLKSVSFPLVAAALPNNAFQNCANLESYDFKAVPGIGDDAFNGCAKITTYNFPAVTTIGANAFEGTKITSVESAKDLAIAGNAFLNVTTLKTLKLDGLKAAAVAANAFKGCTGLTEINLPLATAVDKDAFADCTNIEKINMPAAAAMLSLSGKTKLTDVNYDSFAGVIPTKAFENATNLANVSFKKATGIETVAFKGCAALENLNFPLVTEIKANAFEGCTSLKKIDKTAFPETFKIGDNAFKGCTALTAAEFALKMTLPSGAGKGMFDGCSALKSLSFPTTETIPANAFEKLASLKSVSFPEATTIGVNAFEGCEKLNTIAFPKVASIGDNAFQNCKSLKAVEFPKVATIGGSAFAGCEKLAQIQFPTPITAIGANAFNNCISLTNLRLGTTAPTGVNASAFKDNTPGGTVTFIDATGKIIPSTDPSLAAARTAYGALWNGYRTSGLTVKVIAENGTIKATPATAQAGETIAVEVVSSNPEFTFDSKTLRYMNAANTSTSTPIACTLAAGKYTGSFVMPTYDVNVTANFTLKNPIVINHSVKPATSASGYTTDYNGVAVVSGNSYTRGKTFMMAVTPNIGFKVASWTVKATKKGTNIEGIKTIPVSESAPNVLKIDKLGAGTLVSADDNAFDTFDIVCNVVVHKVKVTFGIKNAAGKGATIKGFVLNKEIKSGDLVDGGLEVKITVTTIDKAKVEKWFFNNVESKTAVAGTVSYTFTALADTKIDILLSNVTSAEAIATGVVVGPNPFTTDFAIRGAAEFSAYYILNATGNRVAEGAIAGRNEVRVDAGSFATGFYVVVLKKADGSSTAIKLIKR